MKKVFVLSAISIISTLFLVACNQNSNNEQNNQQKENTSPFSMIMKDKEEYKKITVDYQNKSIEVQTLDFVPAKYHYDGTIIKSDDIDVIKASAEYIRVFEEPANAVLTYQDTYFDVSQRIFFDGKEEKKLNITQDYPDVNSQFICYIYDIDNHLIRILADASYERDGYSYSGFGILKYNLITDEYDYKFLKDENGELLGFGGTDPYAITYNGNFIYSNNSKIYEVNQLGEVKTLYDWEQFLKDIQKDSKTVNEISRHTVPFNAAGIKDDRLAIAYYIQKQEGLFTVYLFDYTDMTLRNTIEFDQDNISVYDNDFELLFDSEDKIMFQSDGITGEIMFMTE